jgi:L-asparaginase II
MIPSFTAAPEFDIDNGVSDQEFPVLVEVTRGAMVESCHRGAAVVVDAKGGIVMAWGNVETPIYARSAAKPLQALALVETGAADAFALGPRELALACGSHHGEPPHVAAVASWLARIGLGAEDLECGAHLPLNQDAADALRGRGMSPSALHNNCSGKHSGFLTTAKFLGEPTEGYVGAAHPVQQRVERIIGEMAGLDLAHAPHGTDGCGIPVVGLPLAALARAMARMADTCGLPPERADASRRLLDAMAAEPLMVSGSTGFATALLRLAGGKVRAKPGAEGVYAASLPRLGLGVALKIEDGAGRAGDAALVAILARLGVLDAAEMEALADARKATVRSIAGSAVGEVRAGPLLRPLPNA